VKKQQPRNNRTKEEVTGGVNRLSYGHRPHWGRHGREGKGPDLGNTWETDVGGRKKEGAEKKRKRQAAGDEGSTWFNERQEERGKKKSIRGRIKDISEKTKKKKTAEKKNWVANTRIIPTKGETPTVQKRKKRKKKRNICYVQSRNPSSKEEKKQETEAARGQSAARAQLKDMQKTKKTMFQELPKGGQGQCETQKKK